MRKARGLTQEALARDIGVVSMTISRLERGVQEPDELTTEALARHFGVSVPFLRYGIDEVRESTVVSDDLPPRLLAFLEMVAVTEPERRHLLLQAHSVGDAADYFELLRAHRTPEHKRVPEPPDTHVEVREGLRPARQPKAR